MKECSNQKIEENKSVLKFNFLSNSNCAGLDFEIYALPANLTEPYSAVLRHCIDKSVSQMALGLSL